MEIIVLIGLAGILLSTLGGVVTRRSVPEPVSGLALNTPIMPPPVVKAPEPITRREVIVPVPIVPVSTLVVKPSATREFNKKLLATQ